MPIEFFAGQPLDDEQLEALRIQIENFDTIEAISPEIRGIVARNWPHLLAKLPPEDDA
jgi:hypothetical protein